MLHVQVQQNTNCFVGALPSGPIYTFSIQSAHAKELPNKLRFSSEAYAYEQKSMVFTHNRCFTWKSSGRQLMES